MKKLAATPQATNKVELRGEELSKILWKGKQFAVTEYGIEARNGMYAIEKSRLGDFSWIDHMSEKNWVDIHDFALVFAIAREIHAPSVERHQFQTVGELP